MAMAASPTGLFAQHNLPPKAAEQLLHKTTSTAAVRSAGLHSQWLRPASEALRGLQENCEFLGVHVGSSSASGSSAGLSLYAARPFARGATIGYWWGVVLSSEEQWLAIRDAASSTASAQAVEARNADVEDFWSPAQYGVFRCLAIPMQTTHGGDHLLASEQCPMAYINDGPPQLANVSIVFPQQAFVQGDPASYAYLACVANKNIAVGDELITQYSWTNGDGLIQVAVRRYDKYCARLSQRRFSDLDDFEQLRVYGGRYAALLAAASNPRSSRVTGAAPDERIPPYVPLGTDGRMLTFHRERYMVRSPSDEHAPILQLCEQWRAAAAAEYNVAFTAQDFQETIRGGGLQVRCSGGHPLYERTVTAMLGALIDFIGRPQATALHCAGVVLLSMRPGDGPMPVHADQVCMTARAREHARQCWSVLLYTSDCQATALPTLSTAEMNLAVTPQTDRRLLERLLDRRNFFAGRVRCGTTLVLRGDVPHIAPKQQEAVDRFVIYALFSPSADVRQIDNAHFPLGQSD